MSRKRSISSGIGSDEKLELVASGPDGQGLDLTAAIAVCLWPWLLTAFDDWGIFQGSAHDVRTKVAQALATTTAVIDEALNRLAAAKLILRYSHGGRPYIAVFNLESWFRHQSYIPHVKKRLEVIERRPWTPVEHLEWYMLHQTPQDGAEHRSSAQSAAEHRGTQPVEQAEQENAADQPETPQNTAEHRKVALCVPSPSPELIPRTQPEGEQVLPAPPPAAQGPREGGEGGRGQKGPLNASQAGVAALQAVYREHQVEPLTPTILNMLLTEGLRDVDRVAAKLREVAKQDRGHLTNVPYLLACMQRLATNGGGGLTAPGLTAGADDERRDQVAELERLSRED
ncbi:MAG TPA: hypothetical protein VNJ70_18000 [Thermoanaerobaculia bacterium]|nr:hypothetical protein [Thermoanaerobaculia bacterium]